MFYARTRLDLLVCTKGGCVGLLCRTVLFGVVRDCGIWACVVLGCFLWGYGVCSCAARGYRVNSYAPWGCVVWHYDLRGCGVLHHGALKILLCGVPWSDMVYLYVDMYVQALQVSLTGCAHSMFSIYGVLSDSVLIFF